MHQVLDRQEIDGQRVVELRGEGDTGRLRISLFLDGLWSLEPYLVRRFGSEIEGVLASVFPPRVPEGTVLS